MKNSSTRFRTGRCAEYCGHGFGQDPSCSCRFTRRRMELWLRWARGGDAGQVLTADDAGRLFSFDEGRGFR